MLRLGRSLGLDIQPYESPDAGVCLSFDLAIGSVCQALSIYNYVSSCLKFLSVPEHSRTDTLTKYCFILVPFIIVGDRSIVDAITRFRCRLDSLLLGASNSTFLQDLSIAAPP